MKKFYITTSIPYANAPPHVGHILDPLIADVLARHYRAKGYQVRFLTGTDEHGVKIVRTAEALGKTSQQLVDENSEKFREMHKILNISWNDFIRTSDQKRHWPAAKKIWQALGKSGDIYWKKYRGLYCIGHEAFITEKDLSGGICRDHQTKPEIIEEENLFFRLSKYTKQIKEAIISGRLEIMPESRKNEILSIIREGLEDVSVSRPRADLAWGIPVPDNPNQTMYVWLEALTSYLSSIGYGNEDFESAALFNKWWPADAQIIGKDNLRFHAAIWPGMLLSAGLELPRKLFVHGFVTAEGQKISKTLGNVISPNEVVKKYGMDPVRYYFLREFPSYGDGDFSYSKFEERYNSDLANGLGNFTARVLTLAEKNSDIKINESKLDNAIDRKISEARGEVDKKLEKFRFHEALYAIWELIATADRYINNNKPWEKKLTSNQQPTTNNKNIKTIFNAVVILDNVAALLKPFLPETSEKITKAINWSDGSLKVKKIEVLFPRIEK